MSEKRFTLHLPIDEKDGTMGYIVDHLNKSTYFIRGENARKDLVNLLNKLNDENEQLKKEKESLIKIVTNGRRISYTGYIQLEKENEQLKKKVERLQSILHIIECVGESDE